MTAVVAFAQTVSDAEASIENAGAADAGAVKQALAAGCGMLEGYYRAGAVSKFEFEAGCTYLRRIANQLVAMQSLRAQAIADGL